MTGQQSATDIDHARIGPKMHLAVEAVDRNGPYQAALPLARRVGPNGSPQFGYRIVNRCLRRDLLARDTEHDEANPHGSGAIVLTQKGEQFLSESDDVQGRLQSDRRTGR